MTRLILVALLAVSCSGCAGYMDSPHMRRFLHQEPTAEDREFFARSKQYSKQMREERILRNLDRKLDREVNDL